MTVYVDPIRPTPVPRGPKPTIWPHAEACHMVADDPAELRNMAVAIGVRLEWIQEEGTTREHFDLTPSKRALAISLGAREVSLRHVAKIMRGKRHAEKRAYHAARAVKAAQSRGAEGGPGKAENGGGEGAN